MVDRAKAQPALERAPSLLDALELLVTERQVLGDLAKAPRTAHDVLIDLTAAVNGHTDNVAPPASGKLGEVVLRDHMLGGVGRAG